MSFAVLKFLKELRLRLVVKICILYVLDVLVPDGRVKDFGLHLKRLTHTLIYLKRQFFFSACHHPRLLLLLRRLSILTA